MNGRTFLTLARAELSAATSWANPNKPETKGVGDTYILRGAGSRARRAAR